jgi:hypothetical protein
VFQFVNQLRKPYRGRGVTCSHHQSATQFKLPFELFTITLLIHDGTLLLYRNGLFNYRDRRLSRYIPSSHGFEPNRDDASQHQSGTGPAIDLFPRTLIAATKRRSRRRFRHRFAQMVAGGAPKNIQLAKNIRRLTRVSVLEALVRDHGVTL